MSKDIRSKKDKKVNTLLNLWKANVYVVKEVWTHHRKVMILTILFAVLISVSPYLQRGVEALLINHLTANWGSGVITSQLIVLLSLIPAVILFNNLASSLATYWDMNAWREMRTRFDILYSEKLASLDVATHENPEFQDKLNLVGNGNSSFLLSNFYGKIVRNTTNITSFIVASVIMIKINPVILAVLILATIPRFVVELKYGERMWSIYQSHSQEKRHLWHAQRQMIDVEGIRELQTYKTTGFFVERIRKILNDFHRDQQSRDKVTLFWKLGAQAFVALAFIIIVWVLVQPVILGEIQVGTFVFILSAALGLQQSVVGFFIAISDQYQDAEGVNTFIEIMNQGRYIESDSKNIKLDLTESPEIIFENISFAYPSKPNILVLKDFNLTIKPGEKIAVVGINGAGKSTFIKLLCRFYDPTEGRILINGVDLKDIDLDDWYEYVALLAQDYATYKLPVRELIHLGNLNKEASDANILDASDMSDADEFIQKWEKKYDQQIGVEFDDGINPSKGQKQKLSLARTLFRNAFVTILDEPTAAVDAKAEQQIFEKLEKVMGDDKSLILISHRFSTVRNADKIIVIDGNNVKEEGTHSELLKLNGKYAQMYNTQAKGYKD